MSVLTLRRLGIVNSIEDIKRMLPDIQANFDILARQAPQLIATAPAAGVISFLVQESDGSWHEWNLLAGAGVSFTQDNTARTLTVKAP